MKRTLGITAFLALVLFACGDDDERTEDFESTCCLNGAFFECSDSENSCVSSDHTCDRDPSRDDECM
jgi:hypothetical protein